MGRLRMRMDLFRGKGFVEGRSLGSSEHDSKNACIR